MTILIFCRSFYWLSTLWKSFPFSIIYLCFSHVVTQTPSLFNELLSVFILMLILSQIQQIGAPSKQLMCLLTHPYQSLSTSLFCSTISSSEIILSSLCRILVMSRISSGHPFSGEWYVETKIWALSANTSKYVYVYAHTHCYTHTSVNTTSVAVFRYLCLCVYD